MRARPRTLERDDFRMLEAIIGAGASADLNASRLDDDRSDRRIWRHRPTPARARSSARRMNCSSLGMES